MPPWCVFPFCQLASEGEPCNYRHIYMTISLIELKFGRDFLKHNLLSSKFSRSSLTTLCLYAPTCHTPRPPGSKMLYKAQMLCGSFGNSLPVSHAVRKKLLLRRIQAKGSDLSHAAAFMSTPIPGSLLTALTSPIINVNYMFLSRPPTHFFQEKPFVPMHLELILTSCILPTEPTSRLATSSQRPLGAILPLLEA